MTQDQIDELAAHGEKVVHITPTYDPNCKHDWAYADDGAETEPGEPTHCKLCGISWTRYIFTQCP